MTRNYRMGALTGLVVVRALGALADSAMAPFVILWAHQDAGLSGVAAGLLFVVQAIGEFSGGLVGGTLADRFGRRRVLLISTTGMALGYGLLCLTTQPALAITLFLLAGVFESAFHPTIGALVGDLVPDDELPHAFSLIQVGANAGRIVGPLIGAGAALLSLRAVFTASGALLLVALAVVALVLPRVLPAGGDEGDEGDEDPEIPPGTLRVLLTDRRLAAIVAAGGLLAITFTWWDADGLVLVREQRDLSTTAYAALFTIAAAAIVALQVPVTRLTARARADRAMIAGGVLQAAGLVLLLAAPTGYAFLVAAVLAMAAGEMIYSPTVSTFVTRRAPARQRAAHQAALSITQDIGSAVGPTSGLALAGGAGAGLVWLVGAALSLVAGVSSLLAARPSGTPRADDQARASIIGSDAEDVRGAR